MKQKHLKTLRKQQIEEGRSLLKAGRVFQLAGTAAWFVAGAVMAWALATGAQEIEAVAILITVASFAAGIWSLRQWLTHPKDIDYGREWTYPKAALNLHGMIPLFFLVFSLFMERPVPVRLFIFAVVAGVCWGFLIPTNIYRALGLEE